MKKKFLFLLFVLASSDSALAENRIAAKLLEEAPVLHGVRPDGEHPNVLLYFWATWCSDCKEKLSGPLQKLGAEIGIPVLLVATDKDAEKARAFLSDRKVALPSVHDVSKELRKSLKAFSVPSWAVLRKTSSGFEILGRDSGGDLKKIAALVKGQ